MASITTAKSSEINVMVPASETDGDWVRIVICLFVLITDGSVLFLLNYCPSPLPPKNNGSFSFLFPFFGAGWGSRSLKIMEEHGKKEGNVC